MKSTKKKSHASGQYHFAVRLVALILSVLVTGGILTYLLMFIMNLF